MLKLGDRQASGACVLKSTYNYHWSLIDTGEQIAANIGDGVETSPGIDKCWRTGRCY